MQPPKEKLLTRGTRNETYEIGGERFWLAAAILIGAAVAFGLFVFFAEPLWVDDAGDLTSRKGPLQKAGFRTKAEMLAPRRSRQIVGNSGVATVGCVGKIS